MAKNIDLVVKEALEDLKAKDIISMDVRGKSDVMDTMIIASGTSRRHVKSLANNAIVEAKKANLPPIGSEGLDAGDWALVDFGDMVLHVMVEETRSFYDLEKLWSVAPSSRSDDELLQED